jgi:hypothetical protein
MGGVHAMMTAAVDKSELALITFSAPYSAAPVFCDGPLSFANDWAAMCGRKGSGDQGGAVSDDEREEARQRLEDLLAVTDIR